MIFYYSDSIYHLSVDNYYYCIWMTGLKLWFTWYSNTKDRNFSPDSIKNSKHNIIYKEKYTVIYINNVLIIL